METGKDLQQLCPDLKEISFNLTLSNYLLCKAIVAEPQLADQPIVLKSISLQNSLMSTLQRFLWRNDSTVEGPDPLNK